MKDNFLVFMICVNLSCLAVLSAATLSTASKTLTLHHKAPCEMCEPTACETSLECEAGCGCVKPAGAPFGWCVSYPE